MTYLHGADTVRNTADTQSVTDADSAVVALVGIAPVFDVAEEYKTVNSIVDIRNATNAAKYFGKTYNGYTIPQALEDFYRGEGGGRVFTINVFDPAKHKATFEGTKQVMKGKIVLTERGIANLVVKKDSTPATIETDYTFDGKEITITTTGALKDETELTVSYDYADVSKVKSSDIIGAVDSLTGKKSGAQLIYDIKSIYGVEPTIIIAPGFICTNEVKTALELVSNKLKAELEIDAPMNTTLDEVIIGRGAQGTINLQTTSENSNIFHHHYKVYNTVEECYEYRYASPFAAAMRCKLDREDKPHYSISNQVIPGIEGVDVPISFSLNDPDADSSVLNSYGVITTINDGGSFKFWGNRNASYPTQSGIMSFSACVRMINRVEKAVEAYTLKYIDGPISNSLIGRVCKKIQRYLDTTAAKEQILDGEIFFDKAKNPAEQLADGYIVWTYSSCPPPPIDRVRYEHDIKIKYLENIGGES